MDMLNFVRYNTRMGKKYKHEKSRKNSSRSSRKRNKSKRSGMRAVLTVLIVVLILAPASYAAVNRHIMTYYKAPAYDSNVEKPSVKAKGAIVFSVDDGQILYGKNVDKKLDPLSTTKLMTVLLTMRKIESGDISLNTYFTAKKQDTKVMESKLYLKPGERMKVKDLMYATLLHSANDAAAVLGSNIAGNKKAFAKKMNNEAKNLGCANTYFTNANGLIEKGNYSSVRDMALIAGEVFKYGIVRKICGTKVYYLPPTNKYRKKVKVRNTNPFFRKYKKIKNPFKFYNIKAGKTGTWDMGNASLLEMAEYKGRKIITVVMKDYFKKRYPDTIKMMDYARAFIDEQEYMKENLGETEPAKAVTGFEKSVVGKINDFFGVGSAGIVASEYIPDGGVKLLWKRSRNASKYRIYRKFDGKLKEIGKVPRNSDLNFIDSSVTKGKTYTYYVRGAGSGFMGGSVDFFLDLCSRVV